MKFTRFWRVRHRPLLTNRSPDARMDAFPDSYWGKGYLESLVQGMEVR